MSRPFPPVHHGTACWSQKSLTTTNITAATACLSLISCRGDIFRVSQPLWRGRRAKPIPLHPHLPTPFQTTVQHVLFIFTYSCCTVSYSWLLMVSLTFCVLDSASHTDSHVHTVVEPLLIKCNMAIYSIYQCYSVVLFMLYVRIYILNMFNNKLN